MDNQTGPLILIFISVFAILGVVVFIYYQMENTKRYVRSELSKFATLVNDAQYNEFTFDKLTESNIRIIDSKLKSISDQLRSLKGGVGLNVTADTEDTSPAE
jgi:uncharacterized protein YigA (DUF484 family)